MSAASGTTRARPAVAAEHSWLATLAPEPAATPGDPRTVVLSGGRPAAVLHLDLGEHSLGFARDEQRAVLLDGFLMDHEPLRREMRAPTPDDAGADDAALILRAYAAAGERILPLLRGAFALLIWDRHEGRLLCVRDPVGWHPLFFARAGRRLVVSACQERLARVASVAPQPNRVAIAQWVLAGTVDVRETFYAGVERLPQGHALAADSAGERVWRYWQPSQAAVETPLDADTAVEQLDCLLDRAVGRCLSLGRSGIFLSGGVDSALVAAAATRVSRVRGLKQPVALAVAFPHPDADEGPVQRAVASELGIPLIAKPLQELVGPAGVLRAGLELSARLWLPCVNPWEPAFATLAEEAGRLGCRVVVSEGGNDWLEANWYAVADSLRKLRLPSVWRLWRAERVAGRSRRELLGGLLWTYGARPLARDAVRALLAPVPGLLTAVAQRRTAGSIPSGWALPDAGLRQELTKRRLEGRRSAASGTYVERAVARTLDGSHFTVLMENRFLLSRELGLRLLDPLLDPDLVALLSRLPPALTNLGGRAKGLARASYRRRVEGASHERLAWAGLDAMFGAQVRGEGPRALTWLRGLPLLSNLGIVSERTFRSMLAGTGLGSSLGYYQAWQVLACEAWLQARYSQ